MLHTYQCSGLMISSEIELSAPLANSNESDEIDVRLLLGRELSPPFQRPSSEVIAELIVEDFLFYTFCRVENGYVGRLPWIADFIIDEDFKRVTCHPAVPGRSEVIPIVVPGTIVAFLLAMTGRCVLHGSAVDIGGHALAFVGVSGQGKSTLAAILCAAGASLVTDDVLPVEFAADELQTEQVYSIRSGHEIRLRDKAASLADRFNKDAFRVTEDERRAVTPTFSPAERLPLSAIVLPRPERQKDTVTARRMSAGEASLALGRCERIEGWRTRDHLRQQFIDIGRIVSSVPVYEVSVPWGPPFVEGLAEMILEACGFISDSLSIAGGYDFGSAAFTGHSHPAPS
jgi:hypothetical protein